MHQQEDYFKLKNLGVLQALNMINFHMFWGLLNVSHVFLIPDIISSLFSLMAEEVLPGPGKMFCCFTVFPTPNDIWHWTSGFYACCTNGSKPDLICCFHQTICQPLKSGFAVLLICDVIVPGRILETKYSKYDWWRTPLSNTKDYPNWLWHWPLKWNDA